MYRRLRRMLRSSSRGRIMRSHRLQVVGRGNR
jgi:hypothetical protein